ncbi:MAG TPA: hypothetical protein VFV67_21300 [Actinophytocola sp.]|uniref:hypothetical protein n=1 Tax=Actinophytocola sp. TaxID=1872138 RepID=UPI002DBD2EA8|nr:hypothetical protein [Actinophytocola sp.]HEU5473189.1 hypothetical protein [Actinophytocola sp.]
MSWQEELRKLDEELAAGQISADDYRVRRDQVLSSAVSADPAGKPGQPNPASEATQITPRPQPTQAQPPADKDDADKTQIVPGDSDRTQAVDSWHTARPADVDRTTAVPGVPPQAYAGGMPPRPAPPQGYLPPPGYPQQQGWQGEELAPPWAGADFPPLAASGSPDWVRQGPEVFDTGDRSNTGRNLLIGLVVVLLIGLGVGAYFLFIKDSGQPTAGPGTTTTTTQPTTTSTRPKDDLEVAELPGTREETAPVETFADAAKANFLTTEEVAAYEEAGATKSRLTVARLPDQNHAYVFTSRAANPGAATTARDSLAQLQLNYGLQAMTGSPQGVLAAEVPKAADHPATIRAHYVHGSTTVRIQVYGDDIEQVREAFDQVLTEQLKALAAGE